jgi:hypothetical protein
MAGASGTEGSPKLFRQFERNASPILGLNRCGQTELSPNATTFLSPAPVASTISDHFFFPTSTDGGKTWVPTTRASMNQSRHFS